MSAVPTNFAPDSVTIAENCAESATTAAPQTRPIVRNIQLGAAKTTPISAAQVPEIASSAMVVTGRPMRSASEPAATQAGVPAAMTRKVVAEAQAASGRPKTCRRSVTKSSSQLHIA